MFLMLQWVYPVVSDVLLPNELPDESGKRVTVNDVDAEYIRKDPLKVFTIIHSFLL